MGMKGVFQLQNCKCLILNKQIRVISATLKLWVVVATEPKVWERGLTFSK